jgi:DNA-directed RNA polymerase subunit RPC12/RpoP
MSDSFQCPKCGASYPHDKRRVGKAVVCTCGHRFLVPPLDYAAPPSSTPSDASLTPRPRRATPPAERAKPSRPKASPAAASDSSSEVLPLAEPVSPAPSATPTRWADPVEPAQAAPLMEAEVIQPAPYVEADDLTGGLFTQRGPYGDPFAAGSVPPAMPGVPPPPPKKRKKKGRPRGDGQQKRFSDWVAYSVFFFFVPASALFTVIGLLQPAPGAGHAVRRTDAPAQGSNSPASPPITANEPPPSGYAITLWNGTKRSSGEFSVDYRQDRGPLDASRQYYWVVTDPSGKIEFPIPAHVWKQRDKLSGKPAASAPGQFMGPYTTFIEEQVGLSRSRISNDVQIVIGP